MSAQRIVREGRSRKSFAQVEQITFAGRKWRLNASALLQPRFARRLFVFVPNTPVRRRDAPVGALVASIALALGKRGFATYLLKLPIYKTVYGAFAVFPVFPPRVHFSLLVTLAAALVAANLKRSR